MSNAVKGFTLMELMVTLSLAAILMSIAVPSYRTFSQNSRITSQVNNLVTAINMARGEAAKRGTRVALCRSASPGASSPACGGTAYTWSTGWLVYAVGDSRSTPLYDSSIDSLIATGLSKDGVAIKTSGAANQNLEFMPDGTTNENSVTAYFAFCDSRGVDRGKLVTVLPTGRPSTTAATDCTP